MTVGGVGMLGSLTEQVQGVSDLYAERFDIDRDADWALLKLQEELGELTQAHLRLGGRGRGAASEIDRADEAADVLCTLLIYARRHGIDLDAAVARKWLVHCQAA